MTATATAMGRIDEGKGLDDGKGGKGAVAVRKRIEIGEEEGRRSGRDDGIGEDKERVGAMKEKGGPRIFMQDDDQEFEDDDPDEDLDI